MNQYDVKFKNTLTYETMTHTVETDNIPDACNIATKRLKKTERNKYTITKVELIDKFVILCTPLFKTKDLLC